MNLARSVYFARGLRPWSLLFVCNYESEDLLYFPYFIR
jgi:hypothetical protein